MIDLSLLFGTTGNTVAEPSLAPSTDDMCSGDLSVSSSLAGAEGTFTTAALSNNETISVLTYGTTSGHPKTIPTTRDSGIVQRRLEEPAEDELRITLNEQRAEKVRSVFADPTMWRYLDQLQLECLGVDTLSSMIVRHDDPWNWFEGESVKKNGNVVMKVEVSSPMFCRGGNPMPKCGLT